MIVCDVASYSRPRAPKRVLRPSAPTSFWHLISSLPKHSDHTGVRVVCLRWNAGETKDGYCQPLEKAEMVRQGRDVTILCYSRMRYVVMQAVAQLEKEGYDPEVGMWGWCPDRSMVN